MLLMHLDRELGGQVRGVPFTIDPGRTFWAAHPRCTLCEWLQMDPGRVGELFDSMGDKKAREAVGIYNINNCPVENHHAEPYGRIHNDDGSLGGAVKWYSFGTRLPRRTPVRSW